METATLSPEESRKARQHADQAKIVRLRFALIQARAKLAIYREHSDGKYNGGMEHSHLMQLIDTALKL